MSRAWSVWHARPCCRKGCLLLRRAAGSGSGAAAGAATNCRHSPGCQGPHLGCRDLGIGRLRLSHHRAHHQRAGGSGARWAGLQRRQAAATSAQGGAQERHGALGLCSGASVVQHKSARRWTGAGQFGVYSNKISVHACGRPPRSSQLSPRPPAQRPHLAGWVPAGRPRDASDTSTAVDIAGTAALALQAHPRTSALPPVPPGQRQRPSPPPLCSAAASQVVAAPLRQSGPPRQQQRSSMAAPASLRAFTGFRTQGEQEAAVCTAVRGRWPAAAPLLPLSLPAPLLPPL